MPTVLAIDPGNIESGYALVDTDTLRPVRVGKIPNDEMLDLLLALLVGPTIPDSLVDHIAIEMVASYGMAVGREVFETCVWVGRFQQLAKDYAVGVPCTLVYRREVKLHHCASAKAKDANITQALIDRFASGEPNRGKGTKAAPGWFYGFAADMWQAYALAVLVADQLPDRQVAS